MQSTGPGGGTSRHRISGFSSSTSASMERLFSDTSVAKFVELPWICVMGETSSGKTSVLSQLSGIDLPSDHTLTTRCPTLIILQRSDERKARVECVSWTGSSETLLSEPQFLDETSWDQIPSVILKTQESLMSGKRGVRSDEWVKLSVQGPEFSSNLTLVDLPGLVQNSPKDSDLSAKIRLLWKKVNHARSILLAVHPATSDFHNAAVWADVSTHCVPVLTKPDLIDPGAESAVVDLLSGKHELPLSGFHLVKGRGQASLGDSVDKALEDEVLFFEGTEPWKSLGDRSCLGTFALREKLMEMQLSLWRETLPVVVKEVQGKRDSALEQMKRFTPITDRRRYFHEQSQKLLAHLEASLKGRRRPSAASQLHQACTVFAAGIQQGSLTTVRSIVEGAHVLVTTPRGIVRGEVVHLDRDFVCADSVDEEDRQSEALFDRVELPIRDGQVEVDDVWSDGTNVYIARKNFFCDSLRKIPLGDVRTDPSWLKDKIAQNRTGELACFLNVDIFESVVADFVEADWKPPCDQLVDETERIVNETMRAAIQASVIPRFPKLQAILEDHCMQTTRHLIDHAREQVDLHLKSEKQPYTLDLILLENITEARHRSLRRELEVAFRLDQEDGVFDSHSLQAILDTVFERQVEKTVEDHMAEEMEIILESYGKIATRRVLDRTPMVCWEVLRSLVPSLQESLWNISEEDLEERMLSSKEDIKKHEEAKDLVDQMQTTLAILRSV